MQPVNIIGGFYTDSSIPYSRQDTVNWLPEASQAAGTKTAWKLRGAPGLDFFLDIPNTEDVKAGPIRGAHNVEGRLFVVSGEMLCEISAQGLVTVRGIIPGVGRVYMEHNQREGGNELLIANGSSSGYVWNTVTQTFKRVTDEGFPGAISLAYMDSFLLYVEPFGRFWGHSDLADATSYNELDRYESEASPDRIVGIVGNQFEVVVLNETTLEFFGNTGQAFNTFQSKRTVSETGCASRNSILKLDNTVMWLGNHGVFYRLNGYQALPISTAAIEQAIAGMDLSQAFGFVYQAEGHLIAYWTFPNGHTWGYDVVTQLWHRRESFGLKRWRLNTLTFWNGKWIGGDFQTGRLYVLNWKTYNENGQPLICERVTAPLHANQSQLIVNEAEALVDTGTARLGANHEIMLSYSDDSGYNFKNWKIRSLGEIGEYRRRVRFRQLGQTLCRVWRLRIASDGPRDLLGAVLDVEATSL